MALPISLYDPMVLIEAAATALTGCYILKLALQERAYLAAPRANPRIVQNFIPASRVIAPAVAPQSSLPVLEPLPMHRRAAVRVVAPTRLLSATRQLQINERAAHRVAEPTATESAGTELKIVPITVGRRAVKPLSQKPSAAAKIQQTDWLQRA